MATETIKPNYYRIHPDTGLNYQMNRFSDGSAQMIGEMKEVAPRIRDYTDYTREFLVLSEQAYQQGRVLHAASYLRSAEFFMFPDDKRKQASRLKFIKWIKEYYKIQNSQHYSIPYENAVLSAYRFTPVSPTGTIVFFGGFDSYNEELFAFTLYFSQQGFDVIIFEGPGQGANLEEQHLPMTHEWHKPCKAVLDYFKLNDVTLVGLSLGGCLAVRAAAFEPRVKRVVCDDILSDFQAVVFRQIERPALDALKILLKLNASALVNTLVYNKMKKNLTQEWGIKQGMHVTGTKSPFGFFKKIAAFETRSVSHLLKQDILLLGGSEDHYVPVQQFYDQILTLKNARSLTARLFTREEQAQNHCHIGNVELSLQTIVSWINGLQERDKKM